MGEPAGQIEGSARAESVAHEVRDLLLARLEGPPLTIVERAMLVALRELLILMGKAREDEDRRILEESRLEAGVATSPPDDAAARLAMLRALPVEPEPPTAEELAMFEQLEADVHEGVRQNARREAPGEHPVRQSATRPLPQVGRRVQRTGRALPAEEGVSSYPDGPGRASLPGMTAARKLDPSVDSIVARRHAMLLALPVADEPPTPEEDAIWGDIEAELRSGVRGHSTEEMLARVDQMRHDAGE